MRYARSGVLAMALLMAGAAHAYIEIDFTGDVFQPPPTGWESDGETVKLPCSIDGDLSSGLPPCVVPLSVKEKARQRAGQVQHICQNVVSAHGYVTVCTTISAGR